MLDVDGVVVDNRCNLAMKSVLLLIILVFGTVYTGLAQPSPSPNREPLTPEDKQFYLHCHLPIPPYPLRARALFYQGSGVVKVIFDESGRASSVVMKQSTKSAMLDANTIAFAQANWRSPGGKKKTIFVPVTYRLVR